MYLLISRPIDKRIIKHVTSTKIAVDSYLSLQKTINTIQLQCLLLFIFVSLSLVLFSIWLAIHFSNTLIYPIIELAHATKKVTSGNLDIVVLPNMKKDEISDLALSFNDMAKTLKEQREHLITTHENLTKRNMFIETILSDLSSGIIVLDINKSVTLANNAACVLFDANKESLKGNMQSLIPNINEMIENCTELHHVEENLEYIKNGELIHLLIRTSPINYLDNSIEGYIMTFDNISKLVSAQKALMWYEVARRIAHEVKNPITPIYLATEMLEKHLNNKKNLNISKYLKIIKRNVNQISSVINEFANFSRMPEPTFAENEISDIIQSSLHSMEIVFPSVKYTYTSSAINTKIVCDGKQISAILDNIIRNSCEATSAVKNPEIKIKLTSEPGIINIFIEDNGPGFPEEIITCLTEPYVTTKTSGTGLGLAIVKKIITEHKGRLKFKNLDLGGSLVIISLPTNLSSKPIYLR